MIKCEITHGHLFCCLFASLLCCCHYTVCIEVSISSPMQGWNLLAATVRVGRQVTMVTMYLSVNNNNNGQQPENECPILFCTVLSSAVLWHVPNSFPSKIKQSNLGGRINVKAIKGLVWWYSIFSLISNKFHEKTKTNNDLIPVFCVYVAKAWCRLFLCALDLNCCP